MASNHAEKSGHNDRWASLANELGVPPEPNPALAPMVTEVFPEPHPPVSPVSSIGDGPRSTEERKAESCPIAVRQSTPAVLEAEILGVTPAVPAHALVANPSIYKSLFKRYRNQSATEVFASYYSRTGSWEEPYEHLASMAKGENWQFVRPEFQRSHVKFPILKEYLNNTFLRLQEEDKIRYSPDNRSACFNTGLQTAAEKDIFALFQRSSGIGACSEWELTGFYDSYAREVSAFRPFPGLATYIVDSSDLVLDVSYEIDINIDHILDDPENQSRLPSDLRGKRHLALTSIEGATKFLKQKVMRNYKTAIPQWYFPEKKIQLLLPLCLTTPDTANLALVADKDPKGRVYRIRTALSMNMAYINARLLTRPDREWLNP